jgi:hypothetical protein
LKKGTFGDCESEIEKFLVRYRVIFPHALDFKLPKESTDENHEVNNDELLAKDAN